jgi:hypothetical protein
LLHRAIEKKIKAAGLDLSTTEALAALKSVRVETGLQSLCETSSHFGRLALSPWRHYSGCRAHLPATRSPMSRPRPGARAHNSDPSAVNHCIEAERGFAPPARQPTEDHVRRAPLSSSLPLPRPRPQAAPQPMPEYVQATDKPQQSAPPPSPMSSDQAGPSDARLEE